MLMNVLWKVVLSFDSMGLFVGSWSPYDISLVVLHSIISFHLQCMLGGGVLNLNEEQPILVH